MQQAAANNKDIEKQWISSVQLAVTRTKNVILPANVQEIGGAFQKGRNGQTVNERVTIADDDGEEWHEAVRH